MITTNRDKFVGFHVTPEVQTKLREIARDRQLSVSALVYRLLLQVLGLKDTEGA